MNTKHLITCDNAIMAENVKEILFENNIESVIIDHTIDKAIAYGGNLAGFEIIINSNDYDKAKVISDKIESERAEMMPWCPECGSEHITKQIKKHKNHRWIYVSIGILFLILAMLCYFFINPYQFNDINILTIILLFIAVIYFVQAYKTSKSSIDILYYCNKCGNKFHKK